MLIYYGSIFLKESTNPNFSITNFRYLLLISLVLKEDFFCNSFLECLLFQKKSSYLSDRITIYSRLIMG